jgi:UDP-glucose 6-dehydrogenase
MKKGRLGFTTSLSGALKEGAAVVDFLKPDRIVIGLESPRAEDIMKSLYKPFTLNGHPIIFMDIASAEMTKFIYPSIGYGGSNGKSVHLSLATSF